jgi:DNA-binding NarL/FixJ family response regulator
MFLFRIILNNTRKHVSSAFISVLIANNHLLIREGLKSMLASDTCFIITGESVDSQSLANEMQQKKPDLVIIDYSSPGFFCVEDIQMIYRISSTTAIYFNRYNQSK